MHTHSSRVISACAAVTALLVAHGAPAQNPAQGSGTGYERELRTLARSNRDSLRTCYTQAAGSDPHAWRHIRTVRVDVGPDGSVSHVAIEGDSALTAPLAACVNHLAAGWRLSSPRAGPLSVSLDRDQLEEGWAWIRAH